MTKKINQLNLLLIVTASICFAIFPLSGRADVERIQKLIADGNLNEALIETNRGLSTDQDNVTYRFLKGLILTRQDKLELARDVFIAITRSNPELPEPYNNLAVIYAALGDYDKARMALEEAINTHPAYATAHENIGDIYAKLASQAYNQALELNGDNNTAKAKLSLVNELFSVPGTADAPTLVVREGTSSPAVASPVSDSVSVDSPPVARQEQPAVVVAEQAVTTPINTAASVTPPVTPVVVTPVQSEQVQQSVATKPPVAIPVMADKPDARQASHDQARHQIGAIKQSVLDWANAWTAQDIPEYLSWYASDFTPPDGRSISQWREIRQQRLATPGAINVVVSDLVVEMLGSEHAQATFTQIYTSDVYSDRVKKTLLLKLENNKWLITLEQT